MENLCRAWEEFIIGKKKKFDVINFGERLLDNIVELHEDLVNKTYRHSGYETFYINDPKRRLINKATVRDRLLHHAIYRTLYPFFDRFFITDSFSCRLDKGVHKALNRFRSELNKVSKNHHQTAFVLKCDIKQFFASVNHDILIDILKVHILDQDIMGLLSNVITSFNTNSLPKTGLPLGNLTSQLFANVYMNVFDGWVKHTLKAKSYIRYADDFVFISHDKDYLVSIIPKIQEFLISKLKLTLHPNKLFLKTIASGIDFLGWTHFVDYRTLRNKTKQRMFNKIKTKPKLEQNSWMRQYPQHMFQRYSFIGQWPFVYIIYNYLIFVKKFSNTTCSSKS